MFKNVGMIDRLIRLVLGLGLLVFGVLNLSTGLWWVGIVALVLLGTAAVGFCPLYFPFGIKTTGGKNKA